MRVKYLIRLDDACPTMDAVKWNKMEFMLDKYGVRPMVGIVPNSEDEHLKCQEPDPQFWDNALAWQNKGWSIALHGNNHCYISEKGMQGLNPFWERSEYSGVPLEEQREKIREGVRVLSDHGLTPMYFFAPSHTFDKSTLEALRIESNIRIISDTIGRYPYWKDGFLFIPQITGHCTEMPFSGVYTFCFHPNTMNEKSFQLLESFLKTHLLDFISFDQINGRGFGKKKIFDKLLSCIFFSYRKMRGLK